jgi:CheY-like chemotaxis protein
MSKPLNAFKHTIDKAYNQLAPTETLEKSKMPLRILIVDDELRIHEVMDAYLKRFLDDFELISASNGQDAVTKAQDCVKQGHPPDFVLMDMKMPQMDGLECTRALTSLGIDNIHLLTAYFDAHSIKDAVDAGAKGVLKKSDGFAIVAKKVADMVRGMNQPAPDPHRA